MLFQLVASFLVERVMTCTEGISPGRVIRMLVQLVASFLVERLSVLFDSYRRDFPWKSNDS